MVYHFSPCRKIPLIFLGWYLSRHGNPGGLDRSGMIGERKSEGAVGIENVLLLLLGNSGIESMTIKDFPMFTSQSKERFNLGVLV